MSDREDPRLMRDNSNLRPERRPSRIEEEVVVTEKGCEVISLFPAEELPIANRY